MQPRNFDHSTIPLNDAFYLYKREIGSTPLLSKKDELALHQAIESHLKELLWICTALPESLDPTFRRSFTQFHKLISQFAQIM